MPNQYNFRSDITTQSDPRFIASRVVSVPEENVLFEELPASFGFDDFDNIEIHFYSQPNDALILSTNINVADAEVLRSHVVSYQDGTFKNYIRVDFTGLFEKKNLILIPGEYRVVFNFFSDEIGSYNNKKMYIQDISESRTEVQLAFYAANSIEERIQDQNNLRKFTPPAFAKPASIGAAEKIFKSGIERGDKTEGLLYENIIENIGIPEINQTFENTIARIRRLDASAEDNIANNLNDFLTETYKNIRERIVIEGDNRITKDEFKDFIRKAVDSEFNSYEWSFDKRIKIT